MTNKLDTILSCVLKISIICWALAAIYYALDEDYDWLIVCLTMSIALTIVDDLNDKVDRIDDIKRGGKND